MGRDFRDSRYYRYCWIGKRTIKEGEACVVWNRKGAHRVVRGPYLKRMFFTSIRFMDRYTCNDKEYLEVCFRDGHTEHVKGPVSLFCNFVKHKSVNKQRVAGTTNLGPANTTLSMMMKHQLGSLQKQPQRMMSFRPNPMRCYPPMRATMCA